MNHKSSSILLILFLLILAPQVHAGQYFALCEGNFGQANSSLWSFDEALTTVDGPVFWDTGTNPLGDVGQSLTLHEHKLYIVMNNSHEVRILDLENGTNHVGDIALPGSSPRFMAIQSTQNRGFISSWTLGGLLVVDLSSNLVVDTLLLGGLPEELLIDDNRLFVSMTMQANWSANNQVLQIDISSETLEIAHTYTVIDGPGSMALSANTLYVTSVYYNDAWESFSGTSKINLLDGTVLTVDHGAYSNYSADIDIVDGVPYRIFGNFIVPLNEDLSFNATGSIGNTEGLYSFSVQNDLLVVGTSDFVAPDEILVYGVDGSRRSTLTIGALPGDIIFYDPEVLAIDETTLSPNSFILSQNYPNPFNPSTTIPFHLNAPNHTSLKIFDARGRLIQALVDADLQTGRYEFYWDGSNSAGDQVSSGIYFAVLTTGSHQSLIKLNLIK